MNGNGNMPYHMQSIDVTDSPFSVVIQTIEHKKQRYDTVGDWQWMNGGKTLVITVSKAPKDSVFLVAMHELAEAYLFTRKVGDPDKATNEVDVFDMGWKNPNYAEPGDDPAAPYHKEHEFASKIESMLCDEMGMNWEEHEEALDEASHK